MATNRLATAITGACGEHYVASYLSGHHLIVAMPRGGIPGSDLFVSKESGGLTLRIQVKTGTQSTRNIRGIGEVFLWHTSYKVIERDDRNLWYAFVWLNGWPHAETLPEVFFVPSKVVIKCLKGCKAENDNYPTYWIRVDDAKHFRGLAGLTAILTAINC